MLWPERASAEQRPGDAEPAPVSCRLRRAAPGLVWPVLRTGWPHARVACTSDPGSSRLCWDLPSAYAPCHHVITSHCVSYRGTALFKPSSAFCLYILLHIVMLPHLCHLQEWNPSNEGTICGMLSKNTLAGQGHSAWTISIKVQNCGVQIATTRGASRAVSIMNAAPLDQVMTPSSSVLRAAE